MEMAYRKSLPYQSSAENNNPLRDSHNVRQLQAKNEATSVIQLVWAPTNDMVDATGLTQHSLPISDSRSLRAW